MHHILICVLKNAKLWSLKMYLIHFNYSTVSSKSSLNIFFKFFK